MIKLLYKPFAIIGGLIAARVGRSAFKGLWAKFDQEPPPLPGDGRGSTAKVVGAQALEGAVMKGTAAAVDRTTARLFHHLFGAWPTKPPKDDDRERD